LAVAYELSKAHKDIVVIEQHHSFGQETSSRNSEVIHAGIYYPTGSFKHKTCIEGKELLYEFLQNNNIVHEKIGKLIVAINKDEVTDLEALLEQGLKNGVSDLKWLNKNEITAIEPNIRAEAAIFSPSTGILDSHSLMKRLAEHFLDSGGTIAYNTQFMVAGKTKDGFELTVEDPDEGTFRFSTRILINSAGLDSDKVSGLLGLNSDEYRLKPCKGDYFRVNLARAKLIKRLVYPVPKHGRAGLGIHATPDLAGGLRLGPDDEYVEKLDYRIDESKKVKFYESVKSFLPFIKQDDLFPDTSGIRPKLQGPGEDFRDYIIRHEAEEGLTGFINLVGIESPGLTACLAIAKIVKKMAGALKE